MVKVRRTFCIRSGSRITIALPSATCLPKEKRQNCLSVEGVRGGILGNSIISFVLLIAPLGWFHLLNLLPPQPPVYMNMLDGNKEGGENPIMTMG